MLLLMASRRVDELPIISLLSLKVRTYEGQGSSAKLPAISSSVLCDSDVIWPSSETCLVTIATGCTLTFIEALELGLADKMLAALVFAKSSITDETRWRFFVTRFSV